MSDLKVRQTVLEVIEDGQVNPKHHPKGSYAEDYDFLSGRALEIKKSDGDFSKKEIEALRLNEKIPCVYKNSENRDDLRTLEGYYVSVFPTKEKCSDKKIKFEQTNEQNIVNGINNKSSTIITTTKIRIVFTDYQIESFINQLENNMTPVIADVDTINKAVIFAVITSVSGVQNIDGGSMDSRDEQLNKLAKGFADGLSEEDRKQLINKVMSMVLRLTPQQQSQHTSLREERIEKLRTNQPSIQSPLLGKPEGQQSMAKVISVIPSMTGKKHWKSIESKMAVMKPKAHPNHKFNWKRPFRDAILKEVNSKLSGSNLTWDTRGTGVGIRSVKFNSITSCISYEALLGILHDDNDTCAVGLYFNRDNETENINGLKKVELVAQKIKDETRETLVCEKARNQRGGKWKRAELQFKATVNMTHDDFVKEVLYRFDILKKYLFPIFPIKT